ncbi:hypothetical protein, partial [Streptomyces sp. B22F1]|uniref:hypothetical protein n=1 Tax=Streptomyces sp. B22F1 TaxID=3153566 RepID=UPI00325D8ECA
MGGAELAEVGRAGERGGRVEPVGAVLEGIGGEDGELGRGLGEVGGEVERVVVGVECGEGGEVGAGLVWEVGGAADAGGE